MQVMADLRAVHAYATGEERAPGRQWVEARPGMSDHAYAVLCKIAPPFRRARGVCQLLMDGKGNDSKRSTLSWEHLPDARKWLSLRRR